MSSNYYVLAFLTLISSFKVTRRLWMDEFTVPFARPGSMFRGNPPQGKLFDMTPVSRCGGL